MSIIPPPHDLEVEKLLLGAMLMSPGARSVGLASVSADDFYDPGHQCIFEAIAIQDSRGAAVVDAATTIATLNGHASQPRGLKVVDLVAFTANVPAPTSGAPQYAEHVRELSRTRHRIEVAAELRQAAIDGDDARWEKFTEQLAALDVDAASISESIVSENIAELMRDPAPVVDPELLKRVDGRGLIAAGTLTIIHGEPAAGKTWLAIEAVRQVLETGMPALVIDYEGVGRSWAARLVEISVGPDLASRLTYLRPGSAPLGSLAREIRSCSPALVVIDGFAAGLALVGLDEDRAGDVLRYLRTIARPLADDGAAVLVCDHVAKTKDGRGRWGRGSGAKLGEADVAYSLEVAKPFARGHDGSSLLRVAKDRHGTIGPEGSAAAVVSFATDLAERLRIELRPPSIETEEWHGPTQCMAAVRALLADSGQEMSINRIWEALKTVGTSYRKTIVSQAAEQLAADGAEPILVRSGARHARLFRYDGAAVLDVDPKDEI